MYVIFVHTTITANNGEMVVINKLSSYRIDANKLRLMPLIFPTVRKIVVKENILLINLKFGFITCPTNEKLPFCLICETIFSNEAMKLQE